MVASRACKATKDDGSPCGAAPQSESDFCFWHDPEHEQEAQEARRLGGLRRRRERVLEGTYDVGGLESVHEIRRLVRIAVLDSLGLENSVSRARVLLAGAQVAVKLLEVGDLEERVAKLEAAVQTGAHR